MSRPGTQVFLTFKTKLIPSWQFVVGQCWAVTLGFAIFLPPIRPSYETLSFSCVTVMKTTFNDKNEKKTIARGEYRELLPLTQTQDIRTSWSWAVVSVVWPKQRQREVTLGLQMWTCFVSALRHCHTVTLHYNSGMKLISCLTLALIFLTAGVCN